MQNGVCVASCSNDCTTSGSFTCPSSTSIATCGQFDSDPCLDVKTEPCGAGMVCDDKRGCIAPPACTLDSECNDNNVCTQDTCESNVCSNLPANNGAVCSSGYCLNGVCSQCAINSNCDDGNSCTENICSAGVCSYPAKTDGAACPGGTCVAGQCSGTCTNVCTPGSKQCDGASGYQVCGDYDGDGCSEWGSSTACAAGSYCVSGVCSSCPDSCESKGYVCGSWSFCGSASLTSCGVCAQGTVCDSTGACVAADNPCATLDCDDGKACTIDSCSAGVCSHVQVATGTSCFENGASGFCSGTVCVQCTTDAQCPSLQKCVGNQCVLACVPLPETCNGKDDDCDGVIDEGELCGVSGFCDGGSCKPRVFAISLAADSVTSGVASYVVKLHLVLSGSPPSCGFLYEAQGWLQDSTGERSGYWLAKTAKPEDVGVRTVKVKAVSACAGNLTPWTSFDVLVRCNAQSSACCGADGAYLAAGASCAYSAAEQGVCDGNWTCKRVCTANAVQKCLNGNVYWYDSCGVKGALATDCAQTQSCVQTTSGANCVDVPPSCAYEYEYECRENEGVRIDTGCGNVTSVRVCGAGMQCVASSKGISCVERDACWNKPGTVWCGDRCVDLSADRLHCGHCTVRCENDEQCVQGGCEPIPGCLIVCDSNADCAAGEVCAYPGDCSRSTCQPINVLEQNETATRELSATLAATGLVVVDVVLLRDTYTFTVTNLGPEPATNVTFTGVFTKRLAEYASHLTIRGVTHRVVHEDPVLAFSIPVLERQKRFTVKANRELDDSYLSDVAIVNVTYDGSRFEDLLAAWNATAAALTLGLNTEDGENSTTFRFTLNPSNALGGVTLPIEIPKCMAEKAAELHLEGRYHIIKDDPVIAWRFDNVKRPTEVTFTVPKNLDEECKRQLRAMVYAQRVGGPISPWLAVFLVPVIGVIMVFFQRFTPGQARKETWLEKDEFFEIARQQGHSEEEIDRQWREYRRRF